jgi:hypothetical protein
MIHRSFFAFLLLACIALTAAGTPARAAEGAVGGVIADTPAVAASRTTAVTVEHEGTDTLGSKLSFEVKGLFNRSSLFTLSEQDEPKLRLLLSTTSEFPARPAIASAYTAVWTFSQGEGTLSFYLAREVGLADADGLDALVAHLAEKTDGIAVKYRYLLQN